MEKVNSGFWPEHTNLLEFIIWKYMNDTQMSGLYV